MKKKKRMPTLIETMYQLNTVSYSIRPKKHLNTIALVSLIACLFVLILATTQTLVSVI